MLGSADPAAATCWSIYGSQCGTPASRGSSGERGAGRDSERRRGKGGVLFVVVVVIVTIIIHVSLPLLPLNACSITQTQFAFQNKILIF